MPQASPRRGVGDTKPESILPRKPNYWLASSVESKKAPLLGCHLLFTEEVGFEPTVGCPTTVFKTAAIGHSATLPYSDYYRNEHLKQQPQFLKKWVRSRKIFA